MSVAALSEIQPLLRVEDVTRILAISKSQLYDLIRIGDFPGPIKLGRCSRWRLADVMAYINRKFF